MYKRIRIGVGILKSSSLFVAENMLVLLLPLLNLTVIVLYFFFWVAVLIYLYSNGEVNKTLDPKKSLPYG